MITIRTIRIPEEVPAARRLIFEVVHFVYQDETPLEEAIAGYQNEGWLNEIDDIQRNYLDQNGTFLVTMDDETLIGTGAIRRLEPGVCELKRLWLRPQYHGRGLGYQMLNELMQVAREKEYQRMKLVTSAVYQKRAVDFYKKAGFRECPMYDTEPDPDQIAMEISL